MGELVGHDGAPFLRRERDPVSQPPTPAQGCFVGDGYQRDPANGVPGESQPTTHGSVTPRSDQRPAVVNNLQVAEKSRQNRQKLPSPPAKTRILSDFPPISQQL